MTTQLMPQTPHKTALFSSGILGGDALKPKMTWAKSSFGTGKKVLQISEVAVFRSGTFRDSWGIQTTWEDTHIDQMVFNFDHLRNTKVFEHVPIRKGHGAFLSDPMESLIGWHTGLSAIAHQNPTDGVTYNYLLTDLEIFDEAAAEHIFEGHWPNRSAEVGHYITNAEAEHWPVYQGFAYVDIPAVEGLNFSKHIDKNNSTVSVFMEGNTVSDSTKNNGAAGGTDAPATPPATDPAPAAAPPATDPAPATEPSSDPAPAAAPDAEPVPAAQPQGTQDHSRPGAHAFTIGGKTTTDFAEVQAYITAQDTAAFEAAKQVRADFVNGLATSNKIAATQIESLTEFAQGLSPEQFTSWSASYESAPALGVFGQHGADQGDNGGTPASNNSATSSQEELDAARAVVGMHQRRGTSMDTIKKTDSYGKLHAALPDEFPL